MSDPLSQLSGAPPAISLGSLFSVLRKRLWMILGIVVAVPPLVGFVVSKQPKIYEATATLIIDSSVPQYMRPQLQGRRRDRVELVDSQETLQTELTVIHSYSPALAWPRRCAAKKLRGAASRHRCALIRKCDCNNPDDIELRRAERRRAWSTPSRCSTRASSPSASSTTTPSWRRCSPTPSAQVYTERNLARRLSQSEGAATWLGDEYGDSDAAARRRRSARSSTSRRRTTSSPSASKISRAICRRGGASSPTSSTPSRSS